MKSFKKELLERAIKEGYIEVQYGEVKHGEVVEIRITRTGKQLAGFVDR